MDNHILENVSGGRPPFAHGHECSSMRGRCIWLVLLLVTGMLTACGGDSSATANQSQTYPILQTMPRVSIIARDFSFDMPASMPSGVVAINLLNKGHEPHQANLARLNDGVSLPQLEATFKQNRLVALTLVTFVGGPNSVQPDGSQEVILNLKPGQYIALCVIAGADHISHLDKGMVKSFLVADPSQGTFTKAPIADGEIALRDFYFVLPSRIKPGPLTFKVSNDGPQPHELALVKLAEGKSMKDALAFLEITNPTTPAPYTYAGGMGALTRGYAGWLALKLVPGHYAALCFIPDPLTGKSHVMLGMVASLLVQ